MQLPDDIWLRVMTFDEAQASAWRMLLSETERARHDNFPVEKRQREFLLGRVALRTLLADLLPQDPADVRLRCTEEGAVEVPGTPYYVSIAHARDRAVAAASRRPIGVDLEYVRACSPAVVDFVMHPDERPLLDTLPMDRDRAFILCWTLKEAALKGLRTGLRRSPKKVRLTIDAAAQRAVVQAWDGSTWQAQFAAETDYFLSVAYAEQAERQGSRAAEPGDRSGGA